MAVNGSIVYDISNTNYMDLLPITYVQDKLQANALSELLVSEDANLAKIDRIIVK
jgi:hypothetical protein